MEAAMAISPARTRPIDRTIYVDSPLDGDRAPVATPEPHPYLQPDGWRFRFPWVKTAVSAPTYDGELLIANRTDATWLLWHNYHSLGLLDAGAERRVGLVRAGTVSARKLVADVNSEYLLLSLSPDLQAAEIVDVSPGEGAYVLRRLDVGRRNLDSVPDSSTLRDLGLSAKTARALQRIGVTTAGQLRQADLGALWGVRHGAAAYAELLDMLVLHGPQHRD
jgi:hypothetical protein